MIDRDLEEKIKKTKEFMELWMKFHNLYKEALKKETIDPEEESAFLETKSLIARKYQALTDLSKLVPSPEDKTFDVISQLLSLQGVSALSDVQIEEIESGWHQSYLALNKVLGALENRKEMLAKINPLSLLLPKMFGAIWKEPVRKTLKAIGVILIAYVVLVKMFHVEEKIRVLLSEFPFFQNLFRSLSSE